MLRFHCCTTGQCSFSLIDAFNTTVTRVLFKARSDCSDDKHSVNSSLECVEAFLARAMMHQCWIEHNLELRPDLISCSPQNSLH